MGEKEYNLNKAVLLRFLRAVVPQIPAVILVFDGRAPDWVVAVLVTVGGALTALDKYIREKRK